MACQSPAVNFGEKNSCPKRIERSKLRDVVADRLKTFILEGNLKSGDRLPTEAELATRFGVSRPSLREATKSLEFLGIVEARPGRGLTVGSVNMDRVTEYLGFHPAMHDVSPEELIDTRVLIEAGVLPHVARRMKQDESLYDKLNAINAELRQARSLSRWVKLDIAFHRELISAADGVHRRTGRLLSPLPRERQEGRMVQRHRESSTDH